MAKLFSWLHLSDIHFQPKSETFNDVQIRKSLPDYLKILNPQCDAIFITGDFRYAPKKEETSASEVIEYIDTILSAVNVKNDRIYVVPGNHDLNRSKMRSMLLKGVKEEYNTHEGVIDNGVKNHLLKDFVFYNSIQEQFKRGLKLGDQNPHGIIDVGPCYILMLNTALIAGTDGDEGHLIVGSKYLCDLLENESIKKPVIGIGHHGLDMLEHDEKNNISNYLEKKGVMLYLCGHTHDNWANAFSENGRQVTVGCMSQGIDNVKAGFSIGTLSDTGDVQIESYMWDKGTSTWNKDGGNSKDYANLYGGFIGEAKAETSEQSTLPSVDFPFRLKGYRLIGGLGRDGIKYVWEKDPGIIVESLAFNRRVQHEPTTEDINTSAYSISTSMGCQLSINGNQCLFCQTGTNKYKMLTADDIALQCIFMAEYDSDCPSYPTVRANKREFAFMGQGEPGLNYTYVKRAIQLTDKAMEIIDQPVTRYIISTCGVTDFMPELISDIKHKIFRNRVVVHFSLNAIGAERDKLMPVNKIYDYKGFIEQCYSLSKITDEKIGVGILLLVDYKTQNGDYYSLDTGKIKGILGKLDPSVFKIDLCTVNKTSLGSQSQLSNENANKYLEVVRSMGFESKLFTSFGEGEEAGCGMLTSSLNDLNKPGTTTMKHYGNAVKLLMKAKEELDR